MMSIPYNYKLMMNYAKILFLFFFLLVPTAGHTGEGNTAKPVSSKTEIQEAEGASQKSNLVDFLSYTTDLSKRFIELESQIDESIILFRFQNDLSEISREINLLSRQVSLISVNMAINYFQLEALKTKAYKLGYHTREVSTPLFKIIDNLSGSSTEWKQKKEALHHWSIIAEDEVSLQLVKEDIITHQKKVDLALELISEKLKPSLAVQKKILKLDIKIHSLILDILIFL